MIVTLKGSVWKLVRWQWKSALFFFLSSLFVYILYTKYALNFRLPTLPLAVIGGALGIFVSFRTNSAYDRWWEGRKLWGRMINTSRHFGNQVIAYVEDDSENQTLKRQLIRRHIAYVHVLRCLLRKQDPFEDSDVTFNLDKCGEGGEGGGCRSESNLTNALLSKQLNQLKKLYDEGKIKDLELHTFDESLRHLLDIQGGCERIKKTPMPPGYGFLAVRLTQAYACLLPLAIVHDMGLGMIPLNVLVCLAFILVNELGRVLEDPFNMFYNGLPLSSISTMIEVNLLERLGEVHLPAMHEAKNGILM